jgi:hypothetical protein
MFNLYKVTTFLQSVPSFANDHNMRLAAQDGSSQGPLSYSPKKAGKSSPTSKGQERIERKSKGKGKNGKNDDNDNDDNGGFLEPIIEDLQGFLKGRRRSPELNV